MMCYKDMTFCPYAECASFGTNCHRSLTEAVLESAEKWWNPEDIPEQRKMAPIAMYADKPYCFEEKT